MKAISMWGRENPKYTRLLLVFTHTLLAITAIALGILLFISSLEVPSYLLYIIGALFFIFFLIYPIRKASFRRRKINDFCLILFYALAIIIGENNALINYQNKNSEQNPNAQLIVLHGHEGQHKTKTQKRIAKEKRKSIRKRIKAEIIKAKKNGNMPEGLAIFLVILSILVSIILLWLMSALACSIACGGNVGLAWVVGILGTGGIITGLVFLIIRILRSRRSSNMPKDYEEMPDTIDVPFKN